MLVEKKIEELAKDFIMRRENHIQEEWALAPELAGTQMYDAPVIGYCAADDPYFLYCKEEGVIGSHHLTPREWMPGAKSVISIFFPMTTEVRKSNAADFDWPSKEWLHARIEGQRFLMLFIQTLCTMLEQDSCPSMIPMLDKRFAMGTYTSNWSERHAAYACGLGTFGLSKGIITEKGMAGRLCSLITQCEFTYKERPYKTFDEYCNMCGACIRNCPPQAITVHEGKSHPKCDAFLERVRNKETPRYGCGKCQVKTPCESKIPTRI